MLFGVIAGLIVGFSEKDSLKGLETFLEAMEAPVAFKIFLFFKDILGAKSYSYSQQKQKVFYEDELLNATDAEVAKAWGAMNLKHHPDKHPNDVASKTKLTQEINQAYDLIKKSRGKGRKK
jgi:ribosomal protein S15P/S13E